MDDKFKLNQTVWCYYDAIVPLVEGKIISKRKTTECMDGVLAYYDVNWKDGGTSGFLEDNIYADKENLLNRINDEINKETIENEKKEYEEYLRLKKKYEGGI